MPEALPSAFAGKMLAEVGEFGLLSQILPSLPSSDAVVLGPGDDSAVLRFNGDTVVSTDCLVEGVHFRTDWSSGYDVGRKAVCVNATDIEAMGAVPRCLVMSLSAPGETPVGWVWDFFGGVVDECAKAGVVLVGGDITRSRDITIGVTIMGETQGQPVVTRAGARVGDVVAYVGRQGYAAAGLAVLMRGFRSPRIVVDAQRAPEPPYGQGRVAALAGATAMLDVSDGFLQDLGHICERSGVSANLYSKAFCVDEPLTTVGQACNANPLGYVLGGGEDQSLVATFPAGHIPVGWREVGVITEPGDELVTVDGERWDGDRGWDHYSR